MKKGLFCILLCVVLLGAGLGGIRGSAAIASDELILDKECDGDPNFWGLSRLDEQNIVQNTEYNGEKCIEFYDPTGTAPRAISPWIEIGFYPDCTYKISLDYIKPDENGTVLVEVKFRKKDAEGNPVSCEPSKVKAIVTKEATGEWKRVQRYFTIPAACEQIQVHVRGQSIKENHAYVDNISITRNGRTSPFSLTANQIFHYPDETGEREVTLTMNPFYDDWDVQFEDRIITKSSLYDKITYSITRDGASTPTYTGTALDIGGEMDQENGRRSFTLSYPLTALQTENRLYLLKATLWDKNNSEVHTETINLYRVSRPQYFSKDGVYQAAGEEPFRPVIGYSVLRNSEAPKEECVAAYTKCKAAGITVIQGTGNAAQLAAANEVGVKLLVSLTCLDSETGLYDKAGLAKVKAALDDPNSSAIFGWAPADEPFNKDFDPNAALEKAYFEIRKVDKVHPVYINANNNYALTVKYCDILAIDPYVGAEMQTKLTLDRTEKAVKIAEPYGKTVCTLVQTYDVNGYIPSGQELREMVYGAYLGGTKMHGYYTVQTAFAATNDVVEEMQRMYESGELSLLYDYFVRSGQYDGHYEEQGDILSYTFFYNGKMYAIVSNTALEEEKVATIESQFIQEGTVVEQLGGYTCMDKTSVEPGKMTISMSPCDTSLYEFE